MSLLSDKDEACLFDPDSQSKHLGCLKSLAKCWSMAPCLLLKHWVVARAVNSLVTSWKQVGEVNTPRVGGGMIVFKQLLFQLKVSSMSSRVINIISELRPGGFVLQAFLTTVNFIFWDYLFIYFWQFEVKKWATVFGCQVVLSASMWVGSYCETNSLKTSHFSLTCVPLSHFWPCTVSCSISALKKTWRTIHERLLICYMIAHNLHLMQ